MKVFKIIVIIIAIIIAALVSFLGYMGMFSSIAVAEREMGPYTYAFKSFTGPYSNTGPVFDSVYNELTSAGIKSERGIGVYYDNPSEVDSSKLKSDCGSIIAEGDAGKVKNLKGLLTATMPKGMFMVAEFPIKNSFSYMVGPMKVYPSIAAYIKEKKYKPSAGVEIYDMKNGVILYLMPVVRP